MRREWKAIGLSLVATVVLTGSAFAQRGGGFGFGGRGGGGAAMLLRMPEVQTELKLSDEQKTKINAWIEEQRGQRGGPGGGGGQGLSPEERQKRQAERRAEEEKALKAILNEDQMKRTRQLRLQQQGYSALAEKAVQDELKLTDDQKTKLTAIQQEQSEERRAMMQSADGERPDFQTLRPKMEAMRKKYDDKMAAVLTEDQKKAWKEMLGAEFKFPEFQFRRPAA